MTRSETALAYIRAHDQRTLLSRMLNTTRMLSHCDRCGGVPWVHWSSSTYPADMILRWHGLGLVKIQGRRKHGRGHRLAFELTNLGRRVARDLQKEIRKSWDENRTR
jgi:hypothetical protein